MGLSNSTDKDRQKWALELRDTLFREWLAHSYPDLRNVKESDLKDDPRILELVQSIFDKQSAFISDGERSISIFFDRSGSVGSEDEKGTSEVGSSADTGDLEGSRVTSAIPPIWSRPVSLPPGARLLAIANWLLSARTAERMVGQAIADMREEYFEALSEGRAWKARWIRSRCTLGIGLALAESTWHRIGKLILGFTKFIS